MLQPTGSACRTTHIAVACHQTQNQLIVTDVVQVFIPMAVNLMVTIVERLQEVHAVDIDVVRLLTQSHYLLLIAEF